MVKDPVRAARMDLTGHTLRGAASFPGQTPYHPRERSLPRLARRSTKDTIARAQFQGKRRTNARAHSELEQLAEGASDWTTPCTNPFLLRSHGQIAAHRRLLAAHVRATTPTSPKRDWRLPSRRVICAGGVRSPTLPCPDSSQVRPPQRQSATGQPASKSPDIFGGILIRPSQILH